MKTKQSGIGGLLSLDGNKNFYADKPVAKMHEFYLTGKITAAEHYVDWFDIIRNCSESDVVKIYINSEGGDLLTTIQMLRAIGDCAGSVITSVEGACMSAATMIFLNADVYEVSPHSMFMFHNYSGGAFGKGGEMYEQLSYEREWSEKLLREVYNDFLTKKEITSLLDNKDIWMNADQVVERLNAKSKKLKAEAEEKEKTEQSEED